MDVHRHEINISVMHSNLNVGRAEEENNFLKNHRRHTVSSEDKRRRIKNEKEKKEDVINVRNARTGCVMKRKENCSIVVTFLYSDKFTID